MKTISKVESEFVNQFQTMIRAFEINNGVKFQSVNLIAEASGQIGYDIVLIDTTTPTEPEAPVE